jgi:hypothetical protein
MSAEKEFKIQWQDGPSELAGKNGMTMCEVLEDCIQRLRAFQKDPEKGCPENQLTIDLLRLAREWQRVRARRTMLMRMTQSVLKADTLNGVSKVAFDFAEKMKGGAS